MTENDSLDKIKNIKRFGKVWEQRPLETEWWEEGELHDAPRSRGRVASAKRWGRRGRGGAPPESTSGSRTPGRKADRREENVQRTEITSTEKNYAVATPTCKIRHNGFEREAREGQQRKQLPVQRARHGPRARARRLPARTVSRKWSSKQPWNTVISDITW